MEDKYEELGQCIDSLNNYAHALKLPLDPRIHVECLSEGLPELVKRFKQAFAEATGENPWHEFED